MQNFGGANKVHYGRCASGVCIKIKVHFGCLVVACPGATATEILLTTYVRTVQQNLSIQDCEQGFLEDQVQIFL